MSAPVLVAFNLLLNAAGSFLIAAALVLAARRLLRRVGRLGWAPGRASLVLLSLPFAKVVVDLARGVPEGSFLWLRAEGARAELGSFDAGLGLQIAVLHARFALGALYEGAIYSQSGPDVLAAGLARHVGAWVPGAIVLLLLAGALVSLGRLAVIFARTHASLRAIRREAPLEVRRHGRREVAIHVVADLVGSPFTAGVLRPLVVFPAATWDALTPEEREATLAHELAHVGEWHVPWCGAVALVRHAFWFVPGIGALERVLLREVELAADARAVREGACPVRLASALVRVQERLRLAGPRAPAAVLTAAYGSIGDRVARLLDAPVVDTRRRAVARVAAVAWVAASVLLSLAFGNH